ncbi:MAG TPA: LysR family transcriptional regulator, partial [Geobacteraceae bacterium]
MNFRINLNLLRVFHTAAKLESFTRAAAELHLTQPGISKHVKELEHCYETRLFERVGKKVMLTQAGEILYRTTSDVFNALNESKARIADLRGLAGGKLSIGASIT